ncbi:MAG: extracellular solute-binding protein [Patescibacteria group bacterium]|nr:extracellular solute-binding protein [Patescibacteria group bacterium]
MKKRQIIIYLIAIVLIIVSFILLYIFGRRESIDPPPRVILKVVGPEWERKADWKEIEAKFNAYKAKSENGYLDVSIEFVSVSEIDYKNSIKEMQYNGKGPNIFMILNNWAPEYFDKVLPVPKEMMSVDQFERTFARVAADDLIDGKGNIYSLPLYIDTLALYYNEDRLFNEHYSRAPQTWDEFKDYVEKLTVFEKEDSNSAINNSIYTGGVLSNNVKKIDIAGAAFGGGSNVNRSQDILMLLVMQNNTGRDLLNIISFNNPGSLAAVKYYTDFTDPLKRFYTWNEDKMFSIDAFTQRKAAMMVNYSFHYNNVVNKTGGKLKFKVAPIPQVDKNYEVNFASYWTPVVPKIAPCKTAVKMDCYELAMEFLNFAAKKENVKLYLDSTNRAAANLELAKEQATDFSDYRSIFASQVFTAKSWHHPDDKKTDKYLIDMIDSIVTQDKEKKVKISNAMLNVINKINELN